MPGSLIRVGRGLRGAILLLLVVHVLLEVLDLVLDLDLFPPLGVAFGVGHDLAARGLGDQRGPLVAQGDLLRARPGDPAAASEGGDADGPQDDGGRGDDAGCFSFQRWWVR